MLQARFEQGRGVTQFGCSGVILATKLALAAQPYR